MYKFKQTDIPESFKCPFVPIFPMLGIYFNIYMMMSFKMITWIRLVVLLVVGLIFYFVYGIRKSKLALITPSVPSLFNQELNFSVNHRENIEISDFSNKPNKSKFKKFKNVEGDDDQQVIEEDNKEIDQITLNDDEINKVESKDCSDDEEIRESPPTNETPIDDNDKIEENIEIEEKKNN
jgi:hypothetical protein